MQNSAIVYTFDPPTSINSNVESEYYKAAIEQLIGIIQQLSHTRKMEEVVNIVRQAARNLTGADGATFVLRDGDQCYYVEENAIGPLWKGSRFSMTACISGWAMLNKKAAVIPDIYKDDRIPLDAYRPTFVKSLAMVPIRRENPIGAIGNYWASVHEVSDVELKILQALADTVSVAIENVQHYEQLQATIEELAASNNELNRFAWVASHDLQEPLRTIAMQLDMLQLRHGQELTCTSQEYVNRASQAAMRMRELIPDLLLHAQLEKKENFSPVSLEDAVYKATQNLHAMIEENNVKIRCDDLPWVLGNSKLLMLLFQNLFVNSIKFRAQDRKPEIIISYKQDENKSLICVRDNGIGIEPEYCEAVFELFYRMHPQDIYPGSGIGLATCRKIAKLHNGNVWLESKPGMGTQAFIQIPVYHAERDVVSSGGGYENLTRGGQ